MCSWLAARAVLLSSSLPVPLTSSSALCRLRFPMTVRLASEVMRGSLQTGVSHEGDELCLSVCLSVCLSACLLSVCLCLSVCLSVCLLPQTFSVSPHPLSFSLSVLDSRSLPLLLFHSLRFSFCVSLFPPPLSRRLSFPLFFPTPLCLSLFLSHQTVSLIAYLASKTSSYNRVVS